MKHAVVAIVVAAIVACSSPQAASSPPSTERGAFTNGDTSLGYRLDRPGGIASFPAVVIGHGSGKTSMNDAQMFADAYEALSHFNGPRGFDPLPTLETLNVPSLWLLGQADDSIPERNTVEILKGLIARGRPFTFVEYPNANHGLVNIATGVFSPIWRDIDAWFERAKLR